MAFDPSVISQIPDFAGNPVAAKEQAYKLADMQTTEQSNRLKLGQEKQAVADDQKAKNILKTANLDSPEGVTKAAEKLTQAGLKDEAMKFMKTMQGLQESKGNLAEQQYRILGEKNDIIGSTAAGLANQYDQLIQSGNSPALANAIMQSRYQDAMKQLHGAKLSDGSPALGPQDLQQIDQNPQFNSQFVRTIAERSKQGAAALQAQLKFHQDQRSDETERMKHQDEVRKDRDEERKIALEEETIKHDRAKEEAAKRGIPEPMSDTALEVAGPVVMADPTQMSRFAGRSAKDPRMGQINEWIAQKLKAGGQSWQDLERLRQNFRAESKSIDKMTSQRDSIESFEKEARVNGERVLQLLDMVDDTSIPAVEGFTRSAKRIAGGVDASELASVLNSFQTQTARIIGGNPNMAGVVTDSARKDLQSIAPQNMTVAQGRRIINRLFNEMDVRKDAIDQQIKGAQERSVSMAPPGGAAVARDAAGTPIAAPAAAAQPPQQPPPQPATAQPPAAPGVDPKIRALWQ